jgi:hypothetical protein
MTLLFSLARIRGTSYYGYWVERTLDKLFSRGQGRSSLKYINCRFCISLEKKLLAQREFGFP